MTQVYLTFFRNLASDSAGFSLVAIHSLANDSMIPGLSCLPRNIASTSLPKGPCSFPRSELGSPAAATAPNTARQNHHRSPHSLAVVIAQRLPQWRRLAEEQKGRRAERLLPKHRVDRVADCPSTETRPERRAQISNAVESASRRNRSRNRHSPIGRAEVERRHPRRLFTFSV